MDHQGRGEAASATTTTATSLAAAQAREDYLEGVAHRVETYESCANAITTATASLQELSANLEKMKSAAQQLNAFTSGWLAHDVMIVRGDDEKRERSRRHPWNPSTRLRDAQARAERAAQRNSVGSDHTNRAVAEPAQAPAHQAVSHRRECTHPKSAAQRLQTTQPFKKVTSATRVDTDPMNNTSGLQEDDGDDDRGVRTTREMIECAVSLAFTDAAAMGIDQSTFEDPRESMDSVVFDASPGKENSNFPQACRTHEKSATMNTIEKQVQFTVETSNSLRQKQQERRQLRSQHQREAVKSSRAQQEFQKKLQNAIFEFQQRKLAVQALQARIAREIQYLEATAADLATRESLLEDAFASYEQTLRLEFHQQEQEQEVNMQ